MKDLIVQLFVLAIVGFLISYIPMEPMLKRVAYFIMGAFVVVILLRWLFPGII